MLWVLNLYCRSSPTKLWKRIFDLRSHKMFFETQSWHEGNFSCNGSMGNVKFESEIPMKTFFSTIFFIFFNPMRTCFASPKDCEKVPYSYFNQLQASKKSLRLFQMPLKNLNFESEISMKKFFLSKFVLVSITMQTRFGSSRECGKFS